MSVKAYIRQDLRDFQPYHAPQKSYEVKVDANENPYGHDPVVMEKIENWLKEKDNITRYPDTDSTELRKKLSDYYQVKENQIICGVGSDQLIEYVVKLFIEPGDKILVPNPSFSMYGISNALNHGVTLTYELDSDFKYDTAAIIERCKEVQPKVLFICTPNNPTGTTISNEDVLSILDAVECPVVLDEAYDEFVEDSMVSYIDKYPNLLILRTFSKAFACAGLRVGYGVGSVEMIEGLNICKSPYNLPSFSQAVAGFILESLPYYKEKVKLLKSDRHSFYEVLKNLDFFENVFPSKGNFILVKTSDDGLHEYLESKGVLVRNYGKGGRLSECMRISVGTKEENSIIIEHLKTYLEKR